MLITSSPCLLRVYGPNAPHGLIDGHAKAAAGSCKLPRRFPLCGPSVFRLSRFASAPACGGFVRVAIKATMGVAGNKIEGEQRCLTPNQMKAARKPQPTSPTRYATVRAKKASGHASAASGHTPMATDSTSNSIVCRSMDASPFASPPKRKTTATGRAPRARPQP